MDSVERMERRMDQARARIATEQRIRRVRAVFGAAVVLFCVWLWGLPRSQGQVAPPDGTYWQAQAETLFQARERAEALQQRVKAFEEAKPAE